MWLDEALDPQGGKEDAKEAEQGPLKTIKKYEIDKKFLKGQNMSN
jgi:hypothetical protein